MTEFVCWMQYLSEPRGDRREDWRAASICQSIYSIGQAFSKHPKRIPIKSFMVAFDTRSPEQRVKDDARALLHLFPNVVPKEVVNDVLKKQRDDGRRQNLPVETDDI